MRWTERPADLHTALRLEGAIDDVAVAHVAVLSQAAAMMVELLSSSSFLARGAHEKQRRSQRGSHAVAVPLAAPRIASHPKMTDQQLAPRRSKRQHKSVAELERRARALFQQEGEELYDGSDASVDLADLSDQEDEVDSDFDRAEEVGDAEQEAKQAEREVRRAERAERVHTQKRKGGAYVDAALRTQPKERKVRRTSGATHVHKGLDRSSLRKSTRVASARAAERRAIKEKKKPRERRVEQYEVPTQQQRLKTAKLTEVLNRGSLKDLLRLEEEKKRVVVKKKADVGEKMSTKWKDGSCTISFTKGVSTQQIQQVMLRHSDEDEEESE